MSGQTSNPTTDQRILAVQGLSKYFPITSGLMRRVTGHVRAVDDVNLYVNAGETLSIVGESGSGKTTLGRMIVRAIEPTRGEIMLKKSDSTWVDLAKLQGNELRAVRRHFHMIFQDPSASLNPRMRVRDIVMEPILYNNIAKGDDALELVRNTLKLVGLQEQHMNRYPHAFSGGQRQRIGIARSLVCHPEKGAGGIGLSYLFIAHDLAVVEHISDRVAVMYVGKIVELAKSNEVFSHPRHPYTEALLSAVPQPDPTRKSKRMILEGEVANPANPPSGCYFHPRCPYATEICKKETPVWREITPEHFVLCHHADQLQLKGMV